MGRPRWQPSEQQKQQVTMLAAIGIQQSIISKLLGVSEPTLRRACRHELATGLARANGQIGAALFGAAMGGNVAAIIFWMKTRAGWKETLTVEMAKPAAEMSDLEFNRVLLANGLKPIDLSIGEPGVVPFPRIRR